MTEVELTGLAADLSPRGMRERALSPRGMRERAFARECALIAESEQVKARRVRARAMRLPLRSNRRKKLMAQVLSLETHAGLMRAASHRAA